MNIVGDIGGTLFLVLLLAYLLCCAWQRWQNWKRPPKVAEDR